MKNIFQIKPILYTLITIFILLLAFFLFLPFFMPANRTLFPLVAILGFMFFILGIMLMFLAKKEKGKLKVFLMLTGFGAIAPLAGSILHNLFYALSIAFTGLKTFFEVLHAGFFILAILVAPVLFIAGIVGSIFYLRD
ncbi:hypothetical protein ACFL57_05485 [Candidatus Margulisiibacteriota bacterium]